MLKNTNDWVTEYINAFVIRRRREWNQIVVTSTIRTTVSGTSVVIVTKRGAIYRRCCTTSLSIATIDGTNISIIACDWNVAA